MDRCPFPCWASMAAWPDTLTPCRAPSPHSGPLGFCLAPDQSPLAAVPSPASCCRLDVPFLLWQVAEPASARPWSQQEPTTRGIWVVPAREVRTGQGHQRPLLGPPLFCSFYSGFRAAGPFHYSPGDRGPPPAAWDWPSEAAFCQVPGWAHGLSPPSGSRPPAGARLRTLS